VVKAVTILIALLVAIPRAAPAHTIPDDLAIQMWVRAEGPHLYLLVRLPMAAMADTELPFREGVDLDLPRVEAMLPDLAKTWISDWVDFYQGSSRLEQPRIVETRVSLGSDHSFASYAEAWAHVTGPHLPASLDVAPNQAMIDVLFDYAVRSGESNFAIHSRLARLAVRVVTLLRFAPANSAVRSYGFAGDPGVFRLDPRWSDTLARFLPLGFLEILKGTDYLLFLFCAALLFRRARLLIPFAAVFAIANSLTLIAAAYNLVPGALWFPVLFETLIALSVVYVALDVIVDGTPSRRPWLLAGACGLIFGLGFAFALRPALQFGGSHALTAVLSFDAGIALGEIVALAGVAAALILVARLGVHDRIGIICLAALAAHTGWHRMLDRAQWLTVSWPGAAPIPWTPPMPWIAAALLAGVALLASRSYITRAWCITASHFSRIRRATS
jgi:hypothetical protein